MGLALPGRIQIAGVIDQAEADLIIEAGADMLGFPLGLEDGREDLSVEQAAAIIRGLPGDVTAVCITYLRAAGEVAKLCNRLAAPWVQLHGDIEAAEAERLKEIAPRLGIIKSLIVKPDPDAELRRQVGQFESLVDAFITDTFDPATGRRGATGRPHDWRVSRRIVSATERPVILAGGLDAGNVAAAIAEVRPAAVDAHTGVESPNGRKDPEKLRAFVRNASSAFT